MNQSSQPLVSVRKAHLESWKPPNVYRNTIALAHAAGYGRQPDGKSKIETTPQKCRDETQPKKRGDIGGMYAEIFGGKSAGWGSACGRVGRTWEGVVGKVDKKKES